MYSLNENDDTNHTNRQDLQVPVIPNKTLNIKGIIDTDGDGLSDADEITLGTNPFSVDSDCDNIDDNTEVGDVNNPSNMDNDTLIDALESQYIDSNGNMIKDDVDPLTGWQPSCGQFSPFAVTNDQNTSSRLEIKILGGTNISSVNLKSRFGSVSDVYIDGIQVGSLGIELYDDGTNGDLIASDNIYSRSGITSSAFVSPGFLNERSFEKITIIDDGVTREEFLDDMAQSIFARIKLGVILPANISTVEIINSKLSKGSNVVNLVDPMLSLQVK